MTGYMQTFRDSTLRGTAAAAVISAGLALASLGNPSQAGEAQAATPQIDRNAIASCLSYMSNTEYKDRIFDQTSPCSALTIADVAKGMDTQGRVRYLFDEASRQIYIAAGAESAAEEEGSYDKAGLNCLSKTILEFPTVNGEQGFTRGFKGLLKIVHSAANNGGLKERAAERVRNGVGWVAEKVCNMDPVVIETADLRNE